MGSKLISQPQNSSGPVFNAEVANFSAGNHNFATPTRGINCSADGVLRVDMVGLGNNIPLYCRYGDNPYAITRIYNVGSDPINVVGLS
jgi:hypothetical protein